MLNFLSPSTLLFLLLPLGITLFILFKKRPTTAPFLLRLSNSALEIKQASRKARWQLRGIYALLSIAASLLILAAARPIQIISWIEKFTDGIDIVISLDVSESMEADDLEPNRIRAAKSVIEDFIKNRPDDRIGMVVFGGESVMKSPLTRDFDFLLSQVEDIQLRELKQGTAIGMGLTNAIARLRKSEAKNKVIVLLTDGDNNVGAINPITAAILARDEGIRVYTIGIGKQDRVVVPIYAYDAEGRKSHLIAQVPSYINPELLKQIALITGAQSYMARDTGMLHKILQDIDKLERTRIKLMPKSRTEDRYFIPAVMGTFLIFLAFILLETRFKRGHLRAFPV